MAKDIEYLDYTWVICSPLVPGVESTPLKLHCRKSRSPRIGKIGKNMFHVWNYPYPILQIKQLRLKEVIVTSGHNQEVE